MGREGKGGGGGRNREGRAHYSSISVTRVTVHVLGEGMHDNVHPELQRFLENS